MELCVKPLQALYPRFADDPWDSISVFLRGYAFEHEGRSPDYGPAAAGAIETVKGRQPSADTAHAAWRRFEGNLGTKGVNAALNALCPEGTQYVRKKTGALLRTGKPSVIEFVAASVGSKPLVIWARDLIEEGATRDAHDALRKINGIGPKIASLFLRDVAVSSNLCSTAQARTLFQPVDIWVRLVVQTLTGDAHLGDAGCAAYLAHVSSHPERRNQGIWYFCVKVAESSRFVVERALADPTQLDACIDRHLAQLKHGAVAAAAFSETHILGGRRDAVGDPVRSLPTDVNAQGGMK